MYYAAANQDISYHYLNHYAIYSGGYREDAIQSMKKLCSKYAEDSQPESISHEN